MSRVGELAKIVWGLSGSTTLWYEIRIGIHACHTFGGVTLLELLGDDSQLFHAPEALER